MKTPDESKCGMECIRTNAERICVKPEKGQCPRCEQIVSESLARIRQLESRLAQVEKERDAAVRELKIAEDCYNCKHNDDCKNDGNGYRSCRECGECPCSKCESGESQYEWRGPCPENTPDPAKE